MPKSMMMTDVCSRSAGSVTITLLGLMSSMDHALTVRITQSETDLLENIHHCIEGQRPVFDDRRQRRATNEIHEQIGLFSVYQAEVLDFQQGWMIEA